jgi:hypothetical protein
LTLARSWRGTKLAIVAIEITDEDIEIYEDLEAIDVESTRTNNVDQFVPRAEIDDLYIDRPSSFPTARSPGGQVQSMTSSEGAGRVPGTKWGQPH